MSEYIEIKEEATGDPDVLIFHTNLRLATAGAEEYDSPSAMEDGSPLAQALSVVYGLAGVRLEGRTLTARRDPEVEWYAIAADISAVLKDFFL